MPIIKLTAKDNYVVRPNASGKVDVNESINIPDGCYGITTNRKSFTAKALHIPTGVFHSNWYGVPEVYVINSGISEVEIRKGDEICEVLILQDD